MGSTRVLVVDDDALLVQALCEVLESLFEVDVVGIATRGEEAVEKARTLHPDVVLIDLMMPGIGGIEATHRISAACPTARIIMLTAHCDPDRAQQALTAGAHGYLVKTCGIQAIGQAIQAVMQGIVQLDPTVIGALTGRAHKRVAPDPCSLLGIGDRPDLQCSYASRQHRCFAHPGKGRNVEVGYQSEWCLLGEHVACPEYRAYAARQDAATAGVGVNSIWQRMRRAAGG